MSGAQGAMLRNNIHFQAEACRTIGRVGSKHNVARMLAGVYPGTAHNRSSTQHNSSHEIHKPILVLELFCDLLGLLVKFFRYLLGLVCKLFRYLLGVVRRIQVVPLPHWARIQVVFRYLI